MSRALVNRRIYVDVGDRRSDREVQLQQRLACRRDHAGAFAACFFAGAVVALVLWLLVWRIWPEPCPFQIIAPAPCECSCMIPPSTIDL